MEKEKLEETILQYMETHHTVSLATEKNGEPHAATVFYVNIGFELYFFSSPTSRHGENFIRADFITTAIFIDTCFTFYHQQRIFFD